MKELSEQLSLGNNNVYSQLPVVFQSSKSIELLKSAKNFNN